MHSAMSAHASALPNDWRAMLGTVIGAQIVRFTDNSDLALR
jgi:hypothetical protein